jgi:hypothetical protein
MKSTLWWIAAILLAHVSITNGWKYRVKLRGGSLVLLAIQYRLRDDYGCKQSGFWRPGIMLTLFNVNLRVDVMWKWEESVTKIRRDKQRS